MFTNPREWGSITQLWAGTSKEAASLNGKVCGSSTAKLERELMPIVSTSSRGAKLETQEKKRTTRRTCRSSGPGSKSALKSTSPSQLPSPQRKTRVYGSVPTMLHSALAQRTQDTLILYLGKLEYTCRMLIPGNRCTATRTRRWALMNCTASATTGSVGTHLDNAHNSHYIWHGCLISRSHRLQIQQSLREEALLISLSPPLPYFPYLFTFTPPRAAHPSEVSAAPQNAIKEIFISRIPYNRV